MQRIRLQGLRYPLPPSAKGGGKGKWQLELLGGDPWGKVGLNLGLEKDSRVSLQMKPGADEAVTSWWSRQTGLQGHPLGRKG